jgi:hypothetical protein
MAEMDDVRLEGVNRPGADQVDAEIAAAEAAAADLSSVPLDTTHTRGLHLQRLLRHPVTLSLTTVMAIVGFVAGTMGGGAPIGAAAAGTVLLVALLVVFVLAGSHAKEDFFAAYAEGRGLNRQASGSLPPSTPLLRKGDRRYAEQIMNGTVPGGLPGALGLYTYEEHRRDSDGNRETDHYRFTVVMHDLPDVARKCSDVYCQRRVGFRFMDSAEDIFRRMKRLRLESVDLDKRFEIFYGADDSENWMHQLFTPKFIVWLAESTPKNFAFEFSGGSLCINVKGHHDNAADLDELCTAASVVTRRFADEAAE